MEAWPSSGTPALCQKRAQSLQRPAIDDVLGTDLEGDTCARSCIEDRPGVELERWSVAEAPGGRVANDVDRRVLYGGDDPLGSCRLGSS